MVRATVLLALLGSLAWWLHGEQSRGRFQAVDEGFLELLLANTRDRFVPDLSKTDQVVFLPLREADKTEYAAWPPLPVDYQMILKGALHYKPSVIVLVDALRWPEPKPGLIQELAESLLPVPVVVVTASEGPPDADPETAALLKQRLASLRLSRGEPRSLPSVAGPLNAPELPLLRLGDPAILVRSEDGGARMLSVQGEGVRAGPALLGTLRAIQAPLSSVRVALGGGAGVLAGPAFYLPLLEDGSLRIAPDLHLNEQNALDLMTDMMLDEPSGELPKKMGSGRVLVIGVDSEGNHAAREQAQALAHALALPRIQVLGPAGQHASWGVAGLLGLSLLKVRKSAALKRALVFLLFAAVACYLAFQLHTIWFPPAVPACLLLAAGLFVRLFGKKPAPATHG